MVWNKLRPFEGAIWRDMRRIPEAKGPVLFLGSSIGEDTPIRV